MLLLLTLWVFFGGIKYCKSQLLRVVNECTSAKYQRLRTVRNSKVSSGWEHTNTCVGGLKRKGKLCLPCNEMDRKDLVSGFERDVSAKPLLCLD